MSVLASSVIDQKAPGPVRDAVAPHLPEDGAWTVHVWVISGKSSNMIPSHVETVCEMLRDKYLQ